MVEFYPDFGRNQSNFFLWWKNVSLFISLVGSFPLIMSLFGSFPLMQFSFGRNISKSFLVEEFYTGFGLVPLTSTTAATTMGWPKMAPRWPKIAPR